MPDCWLVGCLVGKTTSAFFLCSIIWFFLRLQSSFEETKKLRRWLSIHAATRPFACLSVCRYVWIYSNWHCWENTNGSSSVLQSSGNKCTKWFHLFLRISFALGNITPFSEINPTIRYILHCVLYYTQYLSFISYSEKAVLSQKQKKRLQTEADFEMLSIFLDSFFLDLCWRKKKLDMKLYFKWHFYYTR